MCNPCEGVWRIGRVDGLRPKGHGFDSRSSRHVGTLGKSLAHNYYLCSSSAWNSGTVSVLCRERLLVVVVSLKSRYRNGLNEWMNK